MAKTANTRAGSVVVIASVGVLILVAAFIGWWHYVYSSPSRTFRRMFANSLSSMSVGKSVVQGDDSQDLDQKITLVTTPAQRVHSVSVLSQVADASTVVTTESISSPDTDFVRYTDIKTGQKNSKGQPFNFSDVLGIWGKSSSADPSSGGAQLFNQTVLSVVPTANLPKDQRSQLLNLIETSKVYKTDFTKVTRSREGMRPTYTYQVEVSPSDYVRMLKQFAHDIGVEQLKTVDPDDYKSSDPLYFLFTVDVWSGQLTKIVYTDQTYKQPNRTEDYAAYNARLQINLPTDTISVSELQTRLQQVD